MLCHDAAHRGQAYAADNGGDGSGEAEIPHDHAGLFVPSSQQGLHNLGDGQPRGSAANGNQGHNGNDGNHQKQKQLLETDICSVGICLFYGTGMLHDLLLSNGYCAEPLPVLIQNVQIIAPQHGVENFFGFFFKADIRELLRIQHTAGKIGVDDWPVPCW